MVWNAFVTYGGFAVDRAPKVILYADAWTVSEADVDPLRNVLLPGGSDLQKILPPPRGRHHELTRPTMRRPVTRRCNR